MVANSKIRTLVNQRTHLRSQLELGGVKAYRGNKRPLTEEELASGKTGNRNLLPREIEERNILVTKVFDPERGAELRDEIQRLEELIQMPDQTRTVALAESTALASNRLEEVTNRTEGKLDGLIQQSAAVPSQVPYASSGASGSGEAAQNTAEV